jgi:hypothetical protein
MPLLVTDGDVLAEISKVDGMVTAVDATMTALGSKVPAATLANWQARKAAWLTWKTPVIAQLSSLFSGWFGVPELGNLAVSWEQEMSGWQTIANDIATGAASIPAGPVVASPIAIADQNANLAPIVGGALPSGMGLATGLVLGIGATALIVFFVRRP